MLVTNQNIPLKDFLHFSNPTIEQLKVLMRLEKFLEVDNPYDFFILTGAAGTGKTSIMSAVIGYLNNYRRSYKIAAPTGRAARILGRKARTLSSTIHSMIYNAKTDEKTGRVVFRLKSGHNSSPTVYIIDEASMIPRNVSGDQSLFEAERGLIYDLIAYVKGANVRNKIIFLGDRYQLPPVGEEQSWALNLNFLEETFNLRGSEYTLTKIKRQEDGSYILTNATEIREAMYKRLERWPIAGKDHGSIYRAADEYVGNFEEKGPESAVTIGVSHKANKFFNDLVRQRIFGQAKKTLEPGDLLMVTQNYMRNGIELYNGDHVMLQAVDWSLNEQVAGLHFVAVRIKLLFSETETEIDDYAVLECLVTPGGRIDSQKENELRNERYIKNKIFRISQMPGDDRYVGALRLMYGHAITCNKAQGGEWKKVYINTLGIPSLKWQYTAVTRGIEDIETF